MYYVFVFGFLFTCVSLRQLLILRESPSPKVVFLLLGYGHTQRAAGQLKINIAEGLPEIILTSALHRSSNSLYEDLLQPCTC